MIERFYYSNFYIKIWEIEVIEMCFFLNGYVLMLKYIVFYSEGGGQFFDYGNIVGIDVKDVYEEDGDVYYIVDVFFE